jgi:hypothetical protein
MEWAAPFISILLITGDFMKLIPTWGTGFSPGPTTDLAHVTLTSMDVPNCWAFAAREGTYLPSQGGEAAVFNQELIRGAQCVHQSPEAAVKAINQSYSAMKSKLEAAPEWLREGELDILEKLSLQRRHASSWFVLPAAPAVTPPTNEYLAALRALCAYYGTLLPNKTLRAWAEGDSDPPDTNSGWPIFSNQLKVFLSVLGAIKLAIGNGWPEADDWIKASKEMAVQIGVPGSLFTVAVARRAGPTRKPQPYDFMYGDKQAKTATGYFTRTRLVYMVSRLFNFAISPLSQQVKFCRSQVYTFWHTAECRAKQLKDFKSMEESGFRIYESDFSSYDMTFTPQHRRAIYGALRENGFARQCLDLMEQADASWSIVTPSPEGPQLGHAAVYEGPTGLLSGMKETTNLDSLHAQAVVLKYMIRKGLTTPSDIAKGRWPAFLNLGDDVLMALPAKVDVSDYPQCCEEEGLKAKMTRGHRMLMRHVIGGKDYAVACRVLQQTLGNEDSYQHVGHFLLGVAARLQGEVHPELKAITNQLLMDLVTGEGKNALHETKCDPALLLQRKEVQDFINSASGKSWLARELSIDARPGANDLLLLLGIGGIQLPNLLQGRNEHLSLLFNRNKDVQQYRTALGNLVTYR